VELKKNLPLILKNTDEEILIHLEQQFSDTQYNRCRNIHADNSSKVFDFTKVHRQIECTIEARAEVYNNDSLLLECGCLPPCREYSYDVSYSLSKWPSRKLEAGYFIADLSSSMDYLYRFEKHSGQEEFHEFNTFLVGNTSDALRDFVKINVYVSDSNVVHIVESADYVLFQLISDIGGQLGIWIGVSVITMSEFFEMLLLTLSDAIMNRKKPKRRNNDDDNTAKTEMIAS